jgi:hypothetical protein
MDLNANRYDMIRVVSTYLRPFKEDVVRFDFEVEKEDEALVGILAGLGKLAH